MIDFNDTIEFRWHQAFHCGSEGFCSQNNQVADSKHILPHLIRQNLRRPSALRFRPARISGGPSLIRGGSFHGSFPFFESATIEARKAVMGDSTDGISSTVTMRSSSSLAAGVNQIGTWLVLYTVRGESLRRRGLPCRVSDAPASPPTIIVLSSRHRTPPAVRNSCQPAALRIRGSLPSNRASRATCRSRRNPGIPLAHSRPASDGKYAARPQCDRADRALRWCSNSSSRSRRRFRKTGSRRCHRPVAGSPVASGAFFS